VGTNFTYGSKAAGNVDSLRAHSGFETIVLDLEPSEGGVVSSTRIRKLIVEGNVEQARALLTRPHRLDGIVVHGEKRGREIGYPTANLGDLENQTIPADGVYAGWLTVGTDRWPAAISIGTNPTFDGVRGRQVEAYAIDQVGRAPHRTRGAVTSLTGFCRFWGGFFVDGIVVFCDPISIRTQCPWCAAIESTVDFVCTR
jgi:riboflavin kinase/FMN adenylyltransferase